jgi:hypothetical protein
VVKEYLTSDMKSSGKISSWVFMPL